LGGQYATYYGLQT